MARSKSPKSSGNPRRRRPAFTWSALPWGKILPVVAVMLGLGLLVYLKLDIETVTDFANQLNGGVAFALLVVLPLLGFPASLLHIAAGIRFGVGLGLLLVTASIGIQLLTSYALVRLWRARFERVRWIKKVRERIPKGAHAGVCVCTVLLPGAPFTAVNYALPLVGVPLRTLLLCAWPIHALRSTVTVMFGGHAAHLTPGRLAGLLAYAGIILGASWWTYRRLQSQSSNPRPAAGGRKQPA